MRARLATPIRYLSNDSHRLRMLAFIDGKSDDVATQQDLVPWRAKMCAPGMSGSPG
jgi:hypothetical protein